jgi:hypothetical protein
MSAATTTGLNYWNTTAATTIYRKIDFSTAGTTVGWPEITWQEETDYPGPTVSNHHHSRLRRRPQPKQHRTRGVKPIIRQNYHNSKP